MERINLSPDDLSLIKEAEEIINQHYLEDWHHIAVACRGKSGKVYVSVNMDTYVGSMAVCAEPIAMGQAVLEGDVPFTTIVAVRKPRPSQSDQNMKVVSPCGKCREMIADYAPFSEVILNEEGELFKTPIQNILPYKYVSNKSKTERHK